MTVCIDGSDSVVVIIIVVVVVAVVGDRLFNKRFQGNYGIMQAFHSIFPSTALIVVVVVVVRGGVIIVASMCVSV